MKLGYPEGTVTQHPCYRDHKQGGTAIRPRLVQCGISKIACRVFCALPSDFDFVVCLDLEF